RVERVDHHLAVDRPGDLAPAIAEVRRRLGDAPIGLAHVVRLGEEVGPLAGVERPLALAATFEQLAPRRAELPLQQLDELERSLRQDLLAGARLRLDHRSPTVTHLPLRDAGHDTR